MDEKHNFTFFGVSIKKNQIKCLGWQHLNVTNSSTLPVHEIQMKHISGCLLSSLIVVDSRPIFGSLRRSVDV